MKTLTIRGLDDRLTSLLKKQAAATHQSVNQFVLDVLKRQLGLDKKKRFTEEFHDLDNLFGRWSEDEYKNIQGKIEAERQIDAELWK